jgi:predicted ester cyclase
MSVDQRVTTELTGQKDAVRSYFHEVLDQGKVQLIEQLFHPDCVMHRPGGTIAGIDAVRGVAERRKETFSQFETQIHDLFGSDDRVVARLSHRGVGGGLWRSRLGTHDVSGKAVTWDAIAIFRFENRQIIEEWVTRDELAMIFQFGLMEAIRDKR